MIDRRLGIPISVSVLLMEVGRRLGVVYDGIGFPGRFLARAEGPEGSLFVDPFNGGRTVPEDELAAELAATYPVQRIPQLLAAVTRRQILQRMLRNLKFGYLDRQQFASALQASDLLLALTPWDLDEVRDHGLIAHRAGEHRRAIDDLPTYVRFRPEADDAAWVRGMLRAVSAAAGGPGPARGRGLAGL